MSKSTGIAVLLTLAALAVAQKQPVTVSTVEAYRHLIGPAPILHAPQAQPGDSVEVVMTVDAGGAVTGAQPLRLHVPPPAGSSLAEALCLAMTMLFRPFIRNGVPAAASFEWDMAAYPPEQLPVQHQPFPELKDLSKVVIKLSRSSCLGTCAGYTLEIHGDGSIRFNGQAWVAFPGAHRAAIPPAAVAALVKAFRDADFFSMDSNYGPTCCDAPEVVLSFHCPTGFQQVRDYLGLEAGMPAAISRLEDQVDQVAGTRRWTTGDDTTIPSLQAEGWDLAAPHPRTLEYLATWGNAQLIAPLLEAGFDRSHAGEALAPAARHGGLPAVRALLAAGAGDKSADLNSALLSAAGSGSLDSFNLLLRAGADPHAFQERGTTLLMEAAASGVLAVVSAALRFGLDPNQRDAEGDSALLYAVDHRNRNEAAAESVDVAAVVRLFLEHGADPNLRDSHGDTAVIRGASDPAVVLALVRHGAQVNVENSSGLTPLMSAGTVAAARVLVAAGADPHYRNHLGETVFTTKRFPPPGDVLDYLKSLGPHPRGSGRQP